MKQLLQIVCFFVLGFSASAQDPEMDSLLRALKRMRPDTNRVNTLKEIGNNIASQDPRQAIAYWKQAVTLAHSLKYQMGLTRCYINIATGYSFLGKLDSSVIYSDTAIAYCKELGDPSRLSLVYLNRADNYSNLSNPKKAILYCDTALHYAEQTNNLDRVARINSILGDVYSRQGQHKTSFTYYQKSLGMFMQAGDSQMVASVYSCMADDYNRIGRVDSSMKYYQIAIRLAESTEDLKNLATYNLEVAGVLQDHNKNKEAKPYIEKALMYARQQDNNLQLATAYSHLCHMQTEEGDFAAAIKSGQLSYDYAIKERELGTQRQAASFLATAYLKGEDYKNAFKFLNIEKTLNDSLLKHRYDSELGSIQAEFEINQRDKEISLLNKDYQLQQQRIKQQRYILIGSIIFAALALAGIFLLIGRYRLRQRMKELELRNSIAADLHDEVGSSLSSIHLLSQVAAKQHSVYAAENDLLSRVSTNARETMEKMSDIVWMIKPGEKEGVSLTQRMERFIYEMCSCQNIACAFEGGEGLKDIKLTMQQRKNFFLIFKEALNNAVKYSGSEKITVAVSQAHKKMMLTVTDTGKGFSDKTNGNGNGLSNMSNRAREMKGTLTIDSVIGKGTTIGLVMPLD
jgi:signal transduction histidine kinase